MRANDLSHVIAFFNEFQMLNVVLDGQSSKTIRWSDPRLTSRSRLGQILRSLWLAARALLRTCDRRQGLPLLVAI